MERQITITKDDAATGIVSLCKWHDILKARKKELQEKASRLEKEISQVEKDIAELDHLFAKFQKAHNEMEDEEFKNMQKEQEARWKDEEMDDPPC